MSRQIGIVDFGGHECPHGVGFQADGDHSEYGCEPSVIRKEVQAFGCDGGGDEVPFSCRVNAEFSFHKAVFVKVSGVADDFFLVTVHAHQFNKPGFFRVYLFQFFQDGALRAAIQFHGGLHCAVGVRREHKGSTVRAAAIFRGEWNV